MAKNPNSSQYKASVDNRANQLNPKHPAYASSRDDSAGAGMGSGYPYGYNQYRGRRDEDILRDMGITIGVTPGDISFHDIQVSRQAAWDGQPGDAIGELETKFLRMSKSQLKELIRAVVGSVPGRSLGPNIDIEGMDGEELVDLLWGCIHQDFLNSYRDSVDRYLADTWIPKFISEAAPPDP